MHDLYLGVCRYDLAKILNYFINEEKYITKDELDYRLNTFDNTTVDRGNKITYINSNHLRKGQLILTSAQMSFLVTYLGIIIGDKIPQDDPVWKFFLTLYDIVNLVTSPTISESEIKYLQKLIHFHNDMYQKLFKEDLKPKFHLLIHYPLCIRTMGPLKYFSCEKYERFHKKPKKKARNISNRISVVCSLANKVQMQLSHRLFNQRGLVDTIIFGPCKAISKNLNVPLNLTHAMEVEFCKVNGLLYKPGFATVVEMNDDVPTVGVITRLIKTSNNELLLIFQKCQTIGLDDHVKGYVLSLPSKYEPEKCIQISADSYFRPFHIKRDYKKNNIVSLRDVY